MRSLVHRSLVLATATAVAIAALVAAAPVALGQLNLDEPDETKGITIEQKLDAQVPLDLQFRDQDNRLISLGDLFDGKAPVILTLNYSSCPALCVAQLDELVACLSDVELTPGQDFRIVTVSIDPTEKPVQAMRTKKKYLTLYRKDGADEGWTFLVGRERNIRALADAVGFGYRLDPETGEYAHGAALILLTPEGRVSRYLSSFPYEADTVRLSLVEASDGKIGSLTDAFFLTCFRYDPDKGGYTFAISMMRIFGGIVPLTFLAILFWRKFRPRTPESAPND